MRRTFLSGVALTVLSFGCAFGATPPTPSITPPAQSTDTKMAPAAPQTVTITLQLANSIASYLTNGGTHAEGTAVLESMLAQLHDEAVIASYQSAMSQKETSAADLQKQLDAAKKARDALQKQLDEANKSNVPSTGNPPPATATSTPTQAAPRPPDTH